VTSLRLRLAKARIAWHMQGHGFDDEQQERLMGRLGDGKILEIIKKYGPIVFQIFIKYILPFLLLLEQPKNPPIFNYQISETED